MSAKPSAWYIDGIRNNDRQVMKTIFESYLPMITKFICENSGTKEDAKDIFMDALEALFRKTRDAELVLSCSFSTYLFEICKRLWYKRLRRKKYESGVTIEEAGVSTIAEDIVPTLEQTERYQVLREQFAKLSDDCQKILQESWHTEKSMEEIGQEMGLSYAYVRKRKHTCKERLIEFVKADRRFQELSIPG